MSTASSVSLDRYLATHYEPACELISGELVEKPMGTDGHSDVQIRLGAALLRLLKSTEYKPGTEFSFRHGSDVRIPDLSVYRRGARLYRGVLDEPAILCIEIVSPSQTPSELFEKCGAYHKWGVPFGWVIDPGKQAAWEYHAGGSPESVRGSVQAGEITVDIAEIFEED